MTIDHPGFSPQADTVRTVCGLCSAHCGLRVFRENGVPRRIEGDPENPSGHGHVCARGRAAIELLNHPDRLRTPMIRTGPRGKDAWRRTSWEEALDVTASRLGALRRDHGPESVFFVHGAARAFADTVLVRLANAFGTPNVAASDHVCHVPRMLAWELTCGFCPEEDLGTETAALVLWGTNRHATAPAGLRPLEALRRRHVWCAVVDPLPTPATRYADLWLRPKPGTDLFLALGLLHVLVKEGLYDHRFVELWTSGFSDLQQALEAYPVSRVSEITWVPEEQIRALAQSLGHRHPAAIVTGNALDHNPDSFQKGRALAILTAITGNLDVPGGHVETAPTGFTHADLSTGSGNGVLGRWSAALELRTLLSPEMRRNRIGGHRIQLPDFRYGTGEDFVRAILDGTPYRLRGGYFQSTNPVTSWADPHRTLQALTSLEFFAVADFFLTPTARMADVVLPAASFLEFEGLRKSVSGPVLWQRTAAAAGECRHDIAIVNELAHRLGLGAFFWDHTDQFWDTVLAPTGLTFAAFREQGGHLPACSTPRIYRKYENRGRFLTPSGKVELAAPGLATVGVSPLPLPEEQHPALMAPDHEFPLICTSYKSAPFRHSWGRQIPSRRQACPDPEVRMAPETAEAAGAAPGEWVQVITPWGRLRQRVREEPDMDPRVVALDEGWWFPEDPDGIRGALVSNYNVLTTAPRTPSPVGSFAIRGLPCRLEREERPT